MAVSYQVSYLLGYDTV